MDAAVIALRDDLARRVHRGHQAVVDAADDLPPVDRIEHRGIGDRGDEVQHEQQQQQLRPQAEAATALDLAHAILPLASTRIPPEAVAHARPDLDRFRLNQPET
ncbi:hypothetical protein ACFSTI_17900 [Rhizorhabdus histidinilytica]